MTDYLEQLLELVEGEEDEEIYFPPLPAHWLGETRGRQPEGGQWEQKARPEEPVPVEGEELLKMEQGGAEGGERALPLRREYELPRQGAEQEEAARGTVLTAGRGAEQESDLHRQEVQAEEDRPALLRIRLTQVEGQAAYRPRPREERSGAAELEKRDAAAVTAGVSGWEARQVDRVFERDARRYDNRFTLF